METTNKTELDLMQSLYDITVEMLNNKQDSDFLVVSIDARQAIMDEFDYLTNDGEFVSTLTDQQRIQMKTYVKEIIELDEIIAQELTVHLKNSKSTLQNSNKQQKILGYVNNAIASSGSYMDYKK